MRHDEYAMVGSMVVYNAEKDKFGRHPLMGVMEVGSLCVVVPAPRWQGSVIYGRTNVKIVRSDGTLSEITHNLKNELLVKV